LAVLGTASLRADDAANTRVGDLYRERPDRSGQQVTLRGEVVKVNEGIMQRNFVHIRDGTGEAADGSNNPVVTTQDTVSASPSGLGPQHAPRATPDPHGQASPVPSPFLYRLPLADTSTDRRWIIGVQRMGGLSFTRRFLG
jgi:hypothetical protein